jgi:hypothetical protein
MAIMRYFPTRSPTGPLTSCIEACTTVQAETTIETAPTVTSKSPAICGKGEAMLGWAGRV